MPKITIIKKSSRPSKGRPLKAKISGLSNPQKKFLFSFLLKKEDVWIDTVYSDDYLEEYIITAEFYGIVSFVETRTILSRYEK